MMLLSNCVVCGNKISGFIKEQETSGLLSSQEIRAGLDKVTFVGPIFFLEV